MNQVMLEPIRILLVEDDEADILLAKRAFEKANIWNRLDIVRNGQEALDYLLHENAYETMIGYPGLVLLDLNLPGVDGRQVLDQMRTSQELKSIPVVIVSTSDYENDMDYGRARGVKHYIIKPLQIDNLLETLTTVPGFRIVLGNVRS